MKKSLLAIPAILTLLGAGIATQSMAVEVEDVLVPVATGQDSTAVGVNDTLNDNLNDNEVLNDEVQGGAAANDESIALNDNEFEDIGNDKSFKLDKTTEIETEIDIDNSVEAEADLEDSDYNAVATYGSNALVDKSFHVTIGDVKVNTLTSDVEGEVEDNYLSFGKDLEQKSYGNDAEAENESFSANGSYQKAESDQYSKSYQKIYQDQDQDSDQEIKQFQVNKEAALNASLQAEKSEQENEALGVNVPVGVNDDSADAQTASATADATSATAGDDLEQEQDQDQDALTLQANGSDDPTNKAYGENDSDQAADAATKSKQGDQKNLALAGEESKQDQDQDAANDLEQDNKALVANKADLENTTTQTALADAGIYTSTQQQSVSLTTGDNSMSGFSMNGVNAVAQNSGVQSFNQITQNIQLNPNMN